MRRTLTAKTTLDFLRKDAKRWLRAIRAGDARSQARLLAAWPRAPAAPSLRDVQHALALEYGHESWIALRGALDALALSRQTRDERAERLLRLLGGGGQSTARRILARDPNVAKASLFAAAACGDITEVERHLAADPEAARKTGGAHNWTALAYVAYGRLDRSNGLALAERLLAAGADANFSFNDGWGDAFTVLAGAVGLGEGGQPSHSQASALVNLLIEAGADPFDVRTLYNVSVVGEDLTPPLFWYDTLWNHCEGRGELDRWRSTGKISLGHEFGLSTLDYLLGNAVGSNQIVRAEWLLDRGADPNVINGHTKQALHASAQLSGFLAMQDLLESRGAKPVMLSGAEGLRAACLRHDDATALALLAEQPELLREPTLLLAASKLGNAQAVALLLDQGADPMGLDADGASPLHRAVQSGSLAVVDRLLEAGADPNLRDGKWRGTALTWALILEQPQLYARLIPLSWDVRALSGVQAFERLQEVLEADPSLANQRLAVDRAPTPLFCLPFDQDGAVQATRLLLAHGGDPTARDSEGESPIDRARDRGLEAAANLMEGVAHVV